MENRNMENVDNTGNTVNIDSCLNMNFRQNTKLKRKVCSPE